MRAYCAFMHLAVSKFTYQLLSCLQCRDKGSKWPFHLWNNASRFTLKCPSTISFFFFFCLGTSKVKCAIISISRLNNILKTLKVNHLELRCKARNANTILWLRLQKSVHFTLEMKIFQTVFACRTNSAAGKVPVKGEKHKENV